MKAKLSIVAMVVVSILWATVIHAATSRPPTLVARVAYLEGDLLRYVSAEEDWVATAVDSPVGPKDVFYSDKDARAEITFPNRTIARLGSATQVEIVAIEPDLTDLYVASGQFRAYNRSSEVFFRISTAFGYVVSPAGSVVELYVGDESVEVASLQGAVQFIHTKDGYETKYDLRAGSGSIIADKEAVARGEGTVDADWDRWNVERDRLWTQRQRVRSEYVPEPLQEDSWVLEENGRWERVYYDGEYRMLWRPTAVAVGWAPFTVGRWTTWYDEQVWIPYEPFGYVTHHYGHWVIVGGVWYWMPPAITVIAGFPRPWVYWYPGRVAWIYTDVYVGWVPLAPWEPYYAVHFWGPGVTVWAGPVMPAISVGALAFVDYAICVHHHHFWAPHPHHGYYNVRVTNINKTVIINNFRVAPVVHKTVFKDVAFAKSQYRFVDRDIKVKPHREVLAQIKERSNRIQPVKASLLAEKINKVPPGKIDPVKRVKEPMVKNRLVGIEEAERPGARFQELKPKSRAERPQIEGGTTVETRKGRPDKPTAEPKQRLPKGEAAEVEKGKGPRPPQAGARREPERPGLEGMQGPKKVERPKRPAEVEVPADQPSRPRPPGGPGVAGGGRKLPRPKAEEEVERPSRLQEGERLQRRAPREGYPEERIRPREVSPRGMGRPQGLDREVPERRSPGTEVPGPSGGPGSVHRPGRAPGGEGQPHPGIAPRQGGKEGHRAPRQAEEGKQKKDKD